MSSPTGWPMNKHCKLSRNLHLDIYFSFSTGGHRTNNRLSFISFRGEIGPRVSVLHWSPLGVAQDMRHWNLNQGCLSFTEIWLRSHKICRTFISWILYTYRDQYRFFLSLKNMKINILCSSELLKALLWSNLPHIMDIIFGKHNNFLKPPRQSHRSKCCQ